MDRERADLIARLEKLSGPDRELDALIWLRIPKIVTNDPVPAYTASIDAALTLVEEGSTWDLCFDEFMLACVGPGDTASRGATPAIALCIAALKARALPDSPR